MINGDNIEMDYNMLAHKVKVVHVEYDTWYYLLIRKNINISPRVENNIGGDCGNVIQDYGWFCDTTTPDNIYFRSKKILTVTDSFLPSLPIGFTKTGSTQEK